LSYGSKLPRFFASALFARVGDTGIVSADYSVVKVQVSYTLKRSAGRGSGG